MFSSQLPNVYAKTVFKWDSGTRYRPREVRRSPQFSTGCLDSKWHIEARSVEGSKGQISVLLVLDSEHRDIITVDFILGLDGKDESNTYDKVSGTCIFEPNMLREYQLTHYDFQSHYPTRVAFIVELYTNITRNELIQNFAKANRNLREDIYGIYRSAIHPDVVLRVGDCEIPTNKFMLSARSPALASMLRDAEHLGMRTSQLEITEFSSEAIEQLVNFIYGSDLPTCSYKMAQELLVISNKYGVSDLRVACQKLLISMVNESTAVELLDLAETQGAVELKEAILKFICFNLKYFKDPLKLARLSEKTRLLNEIIARIAFFVSTQ